MDAQGVKAEKDLDKEFEHQVTLIPGFTWPHPAKGLSLKDAFSSKHSAKVDEIHDK